jgi:hypothetical protein
VFAAAVGIDTFGKRRHRFPLRIFARKVDCSRWVGVLPYRKDRKRRKTANPEEFSERLHENGVQPNESLIARQNPKSSHSDCKAILSSIRYLRLSEYSLSREHPSNAIL